MNLNYEDQILPMLRSTCTMYRLLITLSFSFDMQ